VASVAGAAGCAKVFKEKVSGAKTDRPELAKAIGRLEAGDVLVVTRLDRLARSTRDLLNVLDQIGKRGANKKSGPPYPIANPKPIKNATRTTRYSVVSGPPKAPQAAH
jgi:hypothetical protein